MSRANAARAVAVATVLLVVVSGGLLVVLYLDASYQPSQSLLSSLLDALIAPSFAAVGAVVTVKRPDNLVGWALSLSGLAQLVGGVLGTYAELALLAKPEAGLPAGAAAGAIADGSWTPIIAGIFLVFLLFPAGRWPAARWRPVAWFVLLGLAVVWIVIATAPGHLDPPLKAYENPLAVTGSKSYLVAAFPVIGICLVVVSLAGIGLGGPPDFGGEESIHPVGAAEES